MPNGQGACTLKVDMKSQPERGVLKSPAFELAGHTWRLYVNNGSAEHPKSLGLFIYAVEREGGVPSTTFSTRSITFTKLSLKVVNFNNLKKTVAHEVSNRTFVGASGLGWKEAMPLSTLVCPFEGFLDQNNKVQIIVTIECPQVADTGSSASTAESKVAKPPPASLTGNTLVVLEGNKTLRAHALHLEQASEIFQGALQCLQPSAIDADSKQGSEVAPDDAAPVTHSLPVPGVTLHQALLLLHCLYAWARESLAASLSLPDLFDLARVADRYACKSVLRLVDSTILKRCRAQDGAGPDAILTVESAPEQHRLAQRLHLRGYQAHCGIFMGLHADEIDLSQVDDGYADILRGASRICTELLGRMLASNK